MGGADLVARSAHAARLRPKWGREWVRELIAHPIPIQFRHGWEGGPAHIEPDHPAQQRADARGDAPAKRFSLGRWPLSAHPCALSTLFVKSHRHRLVHFDLRSLSVRLHLRSEGALSGGCRLGGRLSARTTTAWRPACATAHTVCVHGREGGWRAAGGVQGEEAARAWVARGRTF